MVRVLGTTLGGFLVEFDAAGVSHPRIVTDDADYSPNYLLYVTYVSETEVKAVAA